MLTNSDLHIFSSGPTAVLVFLSILAILFSLFIYRKTNPIIPKLQKYTLVFLRISSLLLLLLVIYETVFQQNISTSQPPVLAVAIDNSASMSLKDDLGLRSESIQNILKSDWFIKASNTFDIKMYTFSDKVHLLSSAEADSLSYHGDKTDIAGSLNFIRDDLMAENLSDILLLSDGNYNSGINPLRVVENFDIPIHTVGIGSTNPVPDLSILKAEHNQFTYLEDSTPITVSIRNIGFEGTNAVLNVLVDEELYSSEIIPIYSTPSEIEHTFQYKPKTEGQKKIELNLTSKNNERTLENNKKTIYINVLKTKLKITTIAGSVSPDLSFLKNALSNNDRYELVWAIQNKSGGYYNPQPEGEFIKNTDVFVLVDYPTRHSSSQLMEQIKEKAQNEQSPILLLLGKNTNSQKLLAIEEFLPIRSNYKIVQERSMLTKMSQIGAAHSLLKFAGTSSNPTPFTIEQLPPVYTSVENITLWPNSETLAYLTQLYSGATAQTQSPDLPFLATKMVDTQKSATIFAYGLWRWSLLMANRSEGVDYFSTLISNLMRWLEPDNSAKGTSLTLNNQKFSLSDKIEATIKVMDAQRNPINDVEIILKVKSKNLETLKTVINTGNGIFLSDFNVSQPGDYNINADVYTDGNLRESVSSNFTVGEYSTELSQTLLQRSVLENISNITGGTYFSADSLSPLVDALQGQKRTIINPLRIYFWNNIYLLIVIILLLVTEWYVRKRQGLL